MPIKGLTDRLPSFPQIGTIRKGGPKKTRESNGRRYVVAPGEDLKYFRVEFLEGEEEAEERFVEVCGEQPREITVMLPFNEIDRCWEAWREAYLSGALLHRCDGETVEYAISPETGEVLARGGVSLETGRPVRCDGGPVTHYRARNGNQVPVYCKPRGRLRVMIPELRRAAYLLLVTGSIYDILNISAQLDGVKQLNGGQLRGIPLVLRRRPRRISTPSPNGKRIRREKWLVSIEADPRWVEAKVAQLEASALPQLPLLTGGEDQPVEGDVVAIEPGAPSDEELAQAFYEEVAREILWYDGPEGVRKVLAAEGMRYDPASTDELFQWLEEHASREANKQAAQEAFDAAEAEQEPLFY
jgi:hypothetical protein